MIGLHFSLKQRKTIRAVILAIGVLLVANLGTYYFCMAIVQHAGIFGSALCAATPFTTIFTLIDPVGRNFGSQAELAPHVTAVRIAALIGSAIFVVVHSTVVYSWYKSMVRSFDMIIRKQSGQ